MKKVLRNIMIGSLAFMTGAAVYTLTKKRVHEEEIIMEQEEIKREYIDLSDQLRQVKKESEELKENIKVKEYSA